MHKTKCASQLLCINNHPSAPFGTTLSRQHANSGVMDLSRRDVALAARPDQQSSIQFILDIVPHNAGELFRLLVFLAIDSFPIRLFEALLRTHRCKREFNATWSPRIWNRSFELLETNGTTTLSIKRHRFSSVKNSLHSRPKIVDSDLGDRTLNTFDPKFRLKLEGWTLLLVSMAVLEEPTSGDP